MMHGYYPYHRTILSGQYSRLRPGDNTGNLRFGELQAGRGINHHLLGAFKSEPQPQRQTSSLSFHASTSLSSLSSSLSSSSSNNSNNSNNSNDALFTFTSPETMVYIEDTDAYGVMYNTNYLRAYERALFTFSIDNDNNNDDDNEPRTVVGGILSSSRGGWSLVGATHQKFKASPPLGGSFVITGRLVDRSADGWSEVWDIVMTSPATATSTNDDDDDSIKDIVVYNSAMITIVANGGVTTRTKEQQTTTMLSSTPTPIPYLEKLPESITCEHQFILQRDEFDAGMSTPLSKHQHHEDGTPLRSITSSSPYVPIRNVLNFFERSRSNFLGGPDMLRRMQTEGKIVWVVIRIDDCYLIGGGGSSGGDKITNQVEGGNEGELNKIQHSAGGDAGSSSDTYSNTYQCHPGQNVLVETNAKARRRNMLFECRQTLYALEDSSSLKHPCDQEDDEGKVRIAQAIITIMALDADTRRPTSNIPDWIVNILENGV